MVTALVETGEEDVDADAARTNQPDSPETPATSHNDLLVHRGKSEVRISVQSHASR